MYKQKNLPGMLKFKYKSWNTENMATATAAVQSNKCTIREGSEIHQVPNIIVKILKTWQ